MELMYYKTKKPAFSQKVAWKSPRFQSHQRKLYHLTLWEWWKREDAKSSWKPCKISRRKIQKHMRKSIWTSQPNWCSKNSVWKKTPLILLVMPSHCMLTKASSICQLLTWSERFNCTWTQWADMETHLSFTQFTVWEVFQRDSQELVLSTVEHSCSTLTLVKFFLKTEKSSESKALMESPTAPLSFVIQLMLWNAGWRTELDSSKRLSDVFAFWIIQSKVLKTSLQFKLSFLKCKSRERMVNFGLFLDIYIMMVSSVHCVSKKDTYIAIISTVVETNNP